MSQPPASYPPQPQTVVVVNQPPQSQALPALVSFFLPGLGQLIQGRPVAALFWIIVALINLVLMFACVGFVLAPILGILCVLDAAWWRPGEGSGVIGIVAGVLGAILVGFLALLVMAGVVGAAREAAREAAPPKPAVAAPLSTTASEKGSLSSATVPPIQPASAQDSAPAGALSVTPDAKTPETESASTPDAPPAPTAVPETLKPVSRFRRWTDSTGKYSVEAEYRGVLSGKVRLRKQDGTDVSLPLERLSEEDRQWIQDRKGKRE